MPRDMSPTAVDEILKRMAEKDQRGQPTLPDSAKVPIPVAAKHDNVSEQTVRKHYPCTQLSPNRWGVSVGFLRHRTVAA
ncbi:MAG: hypothetical protein WAK55_27925 [Xanthobacteraceae bacterium]